MKRSLLFLLKHPTDLPDFRGWDEEFYVAQSPNTEHALQAMAHQPYEAVIADIGFQQNAELSFFDQAMNRHPKVSRLALCDPGGKKEIKSAHSIHQYLSRPCTVQDIVTAVERARFMDNWLLDLQFKRIYKLLKNLPSIPAVYFRLLKELQTVDADIESVGRIVAEDPALTAQILKVVNSAYFGLERNITSTVEAVSYLGIERTKALALVTHTFKNFGGIQCKSFTLDQLWQHSVRVGTIAQKIARQETGDHKIAEEAYTAGILHDVGKLMVASNLPAELDKAADLARTKQIPLFEAEWEAIGATHAEIGACVMGSWGLPARIVEAIAFHHTPEKYFDPSFNSATALHVADWLEYESAPPERQNQVRRLNEDFLARKRLDEKLETWREMWNPAGQIA